MYDSGMDPRDQAGGIGISLAGRDEPFGQGHSLKALGASFVRLSFHLPLRTSEAAAIEAAREAGASVLAVIKGSPAAPWTPELREAVRRFCTQVRHWEIGFEPDDPASGWPQDNLVTYADQLRAAADLIKAIDPSALIHNGGLGRSLPKGIARLYDLGVGDSIDIWNVHPYMNPLMPDARGGLRYFQEMIQKTLASYQGDAKPLWWSSIACPGMSDPALARHWWLGKNPTEALQAEWLKTVYTLAPTWGVQRVFWEGWQDQTPGQTQTGIDYFGLLRADGTAKPAFETLAHLSFVGRSA